MLGLGSPDIVVCMRPIVLSILLGATFGLAAAAVTVARDAWRDIDEAQASILFRGEDMGLERTLTTDYEADDHSHFQEVALWTGEAGRRLGIRFVAFHPGRAGRLPTSLDADLIHSVWPETFEAAPTALGPVQKGVNLLGPLAYRRFWSDGDACVAAHQTFGATERKRANKLIALFYCRGDGIPPVEAEIAWILKSIGGARREDSTAAAAACS